MNLLEKGCSEKRSRRHGVAIAEKLVGDGHAGVDRYCRGSLRTAVRNSDCSVFVTPRRERSDKRSHRVRISVRLGPMLDARKAQMIARTKKPYVKPTVTRKLYEEPTVRKLTLEQAKLKLFGAAVMGDRGAMELLEVLFDYLPQREFEKSA